jgi:hypothetical protein
MGEGLAEPQITVTFRTLKMMRSANGCLEPIKFTRLSNCFQRWAECATGGRELQAASVEEKGGACGGRRGRELMAHFAAWNLAI